MSISDIVKINRRRWEIEESFMIMKSYIRARPVYLQREERIKAHFLTCFMSLLVFRIMEKQINNLAGADGVVTADNILQPFVIRMLLKLPTPFTLEPLNTPKQPN